jgi:hypothetical protein
MVTRDFDLCERLLDGPHETIAAISLAEQEVLSSGCFKPKDQYFAETDRGVWVASGNAATSTTIVRRLPSPVAHYVGRFDDLAKDYEHAKANAGALSSRLEHIPHNPESTAGILHFHDYLTLRWYEAFDRLRDGVLNEDLLAVGVEQSGSDDASGAEIKSERAASEWRLEWNGYVLDGESGAGWKKMFIQFRETHDYFPDCPAASQIGAEAVMQPVSESTEVLAAKCYPQGFLEKVLRGSAKKEIHYAFEKVFPEGGSDEINVGDRNEMIIKELRNRGSRKAGENVARSIYRYVKCRRNFGLKV